MALPDDMKWLCDVEGLDVEDGLTYCGSPQQLLKFIRTFADSLDEKSTEIDNAFKEGDINLYTIKVHALKSTARIMGAKELSSLAEELEKAGNENDLDKITSKTGRLLEMYSGYKEKLSEIGTTPEEIVEGDSEPCDKPAVSESDLANAYEALKEFIPQMDYDAVEMIISEIKEYQLPKRDEEIFTKLEKMLPTLDWEAMDILIKQ